MLKYIQFQRNDLIVSKHVHVIHFQIIQIMKLVIGCQIGRK